MASFSHPWGSKGNSGLFFHFEEFRIFQNLDFINNFAENEAKYLLSRVLSRLAGMSK